MEDIYSNSRVLPLRGDINFRDFGGYLNSAGRQIKRGGIYRSGSLSALSDADMAEISRLGLNRIIDLRSELEINRGGLDRFYPGNENKYDFLSFGYGDPYLADAQVSTELEWDTRQVDFPSIYINMLEQNKPAIRQIFDRFADPLQYPILIHCTQGKDRTGIIVALLLLLLEVPRPTILADYMLTGELIDVNSQLAKFEAYLREFDELVPQGITANDWAPFFTCLPRAMENLFAHLETEYNGVTHFLDSIGVNRQQRMSIYENLIENGT